MNIQDDLPSLFAYTRWADDRVLAACGKLSAADYTREPAPGWSSLRSTLVHLAGATEAWARRLSGETVAAMPTEDEVPMLADASRMLLHAHEKLARILGELTPELRAEVWSYKNLRGEPKRVPRWAVLRHIVNHGTYHRGQIASKLRLLGHEPPQTDLILWGIESTI